MSKGLTASLSAGVAAEKKKHDPAAKALAAAAKKLQDKQKVGVPLVESARQGLAAAKLLAGDKELAGIVAKLDARAKAIASEMAALSKDHAAKQTAAAATGKALKAAEVARDAAVKKHADATKLFEAKAWETDQLRTGRRDINTRLTATRRRKETLELLAGYSATQKAADVARSGRSGRGSINGSTRSCPLSGSTPLPSASTSLRPP